MQPLLSKKNIWLRTKLMHALHQPQAPPSEEKKQVRQVNMGTDLHLVSVSAPVGPLTPMWLCHCTCTAQKLCVTAHRGEGKRQRGRERERGCFVLLVLTKKRQRWKGESTRRKGRRKGNYVAAPLHHHPPTRTNKQRDSNTNNLPTCTSGSF